MLSKTAQPVQCTGMPGLNDTRQSPPTHRSPIDVKLRVWVVLLANVQKTRPSTTANGCTWAADGGMADIAVSRHGVRRPSDATSTKDRHGVCYRARGTGPGPRQQMSSPEDVRKSYSHDPRVALRP